MLPDVSIKVITSRWARGSMAGDDTEGAQDALEEEPRLKYSPLGGESPRAAASAGTPATRLCVSDKVLAVGHRDGSVQLLDHLGNQVRWAGREAGAPLQQRRRRHRNPCCRCRRRLRLFPWASQTLPCKLLSHHTAIAAVGAGQGAAGALPGGDRPLL